MNTKKLLTLDAAESSAASTKTTKIITTGPPLAMERAEQRLARLEAENADLREYRNQREAVDAQKVADELVIAEKMKKGLTRAQAIGVIRKQTENNIAWEAEMATRRPTITELLKQFRCTEGPVPMKCRQAIRLRYAFVTLNEIQRAQDVIAEGKASAAAK